MEKQDAKHMKYGKYVKNTLTGEIYQLIENMSTEKETVKVVNKRNLERYDILTAWIRNWETNNMGFRDRFTEDIEECKTEKLTYEKEQKIADVMPHNKIPFITPDYEKLFVVTDLDFVEFDIYNFITGEYSGTEVRRVIADDCETNGFNACHFHFKSGSYYHICEFAERVNPNGDRVRPLKELII